MKFTICALERVAQRLVLTAQLLVWPAIYAAVLGVTGWAFWHDDKISLIANNKLSFDERVAAIEWGGVSLVIIALVYAIASIIERIRKGRYNANFVFGALNRWLVGLLALPFIVALRQPRIESTTPIWTALLAATAAGLIAASVYGWPRRSTQALDAAAPTKQRPWLHKLAPWCVAGAVLFLWLAYGYLLSRFSITNHHALNTRTTDLGYYDNIFYQSLHGRPLGCSFTRGGSHISAHFDPILVLLSPLYALYPRAELLLGLQSVWLGAGVVPVYLIAKIKLASRSAGLVMALSYVLYPALHGANMYEFHSLALITPLMLWLLYFLEQRHFKSYASMLLLLCACREDIPLLLCFVGLYAIVSGKDRFATIGVITIVSCLLYYVLIKKYVMHDTGLLNSGSKESYSYEYYFRDLIPHSKGVLDMLLTLVENPIFVLKKVLANEQKLLFLLQLFVPLGLLSFFAKRQRLMLVYGLLVCLLASRKPVFKISFQYACLIFPIAFAIAPDGLRQLTDGSRLQRAFGLDGKRLGRAMLAFVLAASVLMSWKFGVLVENTSFRAGFSGVRRPPLEGTYKLRYQKLREMVDMIPPGASVATTDRLGPHVSGRKKAFFVRQKQATDYVLAEGRAIKGGGKEWHEQRLKTGELIELKRLGGIGLWRVDPTRVEATTKAVLAGRKRKRDQAAAKKKRAASEREAAKNRMAKQKAAKDKSKESPSPDVNKAPGDAKPGSRGIPVRPTIGGAKFRRPQRK